MVYNIKPGFKGNINKVFRLKAKLRALFFTSKFRGKKTPIIINNYNRLDYLKQLLKWLETHNYTNIYIIDNASTYPPLLAFYKSCKYPIFKLTANVGHTALWDTHIHLWFTNQYYVYTDPDIIPVAECPSDPLDYFMEVLNTYPEITKVGFGLKIDDIPDFYPRKSEVIKWESKFWNDPIDKDLYKAVIDTTFALYRPNTRYQQWETTLRTGGRYVARHLPWYEDLAHLSEEEVYFKKVTTKVSSWYKEETYNG